MGAPLPVPALAEGYSQVEQSPSATQFENLHPAAIRQIAHRARSHVTARRPRGVVSAAEAQDALGAFQQAVQTGDLQSLVDVLAPDVVLLSDGGGVKQALPRPVVGANRVAPCWPSEYRESLVR